LKRPGIACFAAGADEGAWSIQELCERIVEAMLRAGATRAQWRVAGVVAAASGRYKEMVRAMQAAQVEPAIVTELEDYGRERYRRGFRRGVERGLRQSAEEARRVLLAILAARRIEPSPAARRRIAGEASLELLLRWVERAATAESAAEVFES
jgi:hypothetical protein